VIELVEIELVEIDYRFVAATHSSSFADAAPESMTDAARSSCVASR